jgi:DNA-binding transcriptional ArsR family regulator
VLDLGLGGGHGGLSTACNQAWACIHFIDKQYICQHNEGMKAKPSAKASAVSCDRIGLPPPDLVALQASAEKACALLKVLAHADRLVLLCRLAQGEFCVSELERDLGIRQPTLSQQLGVLRQEGLVGTRREGKHIYYQLISDDAAAVMHVLHSRICGDVRPAHESH